jgi:RND family efflux transporter MFP subunit
MWPVYAVGVLIVVAAISWWWTRRADTGGPLPADARFYHVVPTELDVKLSKDGELQAVDNIDINCAVEGSTVVTQLVDEGTVVKKGDVLVRLDSSTIRQKIDDMSLQLQTADAALTTAVELWHIQESQNDADLSAAQVSLQLAQIDQEQYEQGTYPQSLANAKTDLDMAQLTLKDKDEDLARTKSLFAKGFMTATDIKKAELDETTSSNDVKKAQTALDVLVKYTHEMDLATKKNALAQAASKVEYTKRINASNLAQKKADVNAKQQAFELLKRQAAHLKDQLDACTITAPTDGIVIYATSSDRNAQQALAEGVQVRERQPLLRLPDTSSMKAVVRILEAQVPKLKVDQRATVRIVGIPRTFGATLAKISPLADNAQRWWNPDVKEYPVELNLDHTPPGLKPGITATADIMLDQVPDALAVPLSAVYSAGPDSYVFVRDGNDAKPQKVKLGRSNETQIEVADGIAAGADVLILESGQGHDLLERNGIHYDENASQNGMGPGGKPGGRRGRNGGGPGGPASRPAMMDASPTTQP